MMRIGSLRGAAIASFTLVLLCCPRSSQADTITAFASGRATQNNIFNYLVAGPGEVIASRIWYEEVRGIAEFDLTAIHPFPNASVMLDLPDSGGATQYPSTTNIYYYLADGIIGTDDFFRTANFLTQITRPYLGPTTHYDVTALVNSMGGAQYLGFLFVTESPDLNLIYQDAFSTPGMTFSTEPAPTESAPVPEPATMTLTLTGLVAVGRAIRRRSTH